MLKLPDLPYTPDALAPHVSARTLELHHGKHHAAYVGNANKLIKETALANAPLEDLVRAAAGDAAKAGLFNNAAQVWNHGFFWNSMSLEGGGRPGGEIGRRLAADFGSYDKFAEAFLEHLANWEFAASNL